MRGRHKSADRKGFCNVRGFLERAHAATRDVAAVFEPSATIRKLAAEIAASHYLPSDWLNDAAKAYVQGQFAVETVIDLSHLRVWAPEPRYMLAMKCISARWDTHDRGDVEFLLKTLSLSSPSEVFAIIEQYYPRERIPPKTQFLIEELFEDQGE